VRPIVSRAARPGGGVDVTERARRYVAALPGAVQGARGRHATWLACLAVVRGFCLDEDTALAILLAEFNGRCQPPWSQAELRQ
jgi:hypothetical protein